MHIAKGRNKLEPVSRAGLKIQSAAEALRVDFRGLTVLDIGSSTGGFTEYALRRDAKKVIAVEKGTRQMRRQLAEDPRVELHEKTDILDFKCEAPDLVLADVSFISLKVILQYVKKQIAEKKTKYLVMLKPQFEAREDQLNRGVVKNEKMRREICKDFENWLKREGFVIIGKRDNELKGKVKGNIERFYYLK